MNLSTSCHELLLSKLKLFLCNNENRRLSRLIHTCSKSKISTLFVYSTSTIYPPRLTPGRRYCLACWARSWCRWTCPRGPRWRGARARCTPPCGTAPPLAPHPGQRSLHTHPWTQGRICRVDQRQPDKSRDHFLVYNLNIDIYNTILVK